MDINVVLFFVLKSSCALTFSFVWFDSFTSAKPSILIANVCAQKETRVTFKGDNDFFRFDQIQPTINQMHWCWFQKTQFATHHVTTQLNNKMFLFFVYEKLVMHGSPIFWWGLRMVDWSIFGHHGATFMWPHQTTFDWSLHCDSHRLKGSQQKMCIHLHVSSCETCPTCTSFALFYLAYFPIQ